MAGKRYSKITRSEQWWEAHPEALRCSAHYKSNGQRCKKEAAPGTTVCNQHGALIPAVQQKAATRIGMSVDDAVKRLHRMLDDPQVEARDKIKILHDLLDRGGLAATQKHLIGLGQLDPIEQLFQDLLSTPGALVVPAQAPAELPAPDPVQAAIDAAEDGYDWDTFIGRENGSEDLSHVVDAEVVEDGHPAHGPETMSDAPPRHIREDLERLL